MQLSTLDNAFLFCNNALHNQQIVLLLAYTDNTKYCRHVLTSTHFQSLLSGCNWSQKSSHYFWTPQIVQTGQHCPVVDLICISVIVSSRHKSHHHFHHSFQYSSWDYYIDTYTSILWRVVCIACEIHTHMFIHTCVPYVPFEVISSSAGWPLSSFLPLLMKMSELLTVTGSRQKMIATEWCVHNTGL